MHAERECHEERPFRRAVRDRRVPPEHREAFSRGKDRRGVVAPRIRRGGVVLRHPGLQGVDVRVALQPLPVVEVGRGNVGVLDDVAAVRLTEDAIFGEVGRPGPDGDGPPVLRQDEELIMHDLAGGARDAESLDLRVSDGRGIPRERTRAARNGVVDDADLGPRAGGRLERLQRVGPLKLVDRAIEAAALSLRAADERHERLEQPA